MEYKCGSIDKGREVATGSATETKTGGLLFSMERQSRLPQNDVWGEILSPYS